MVLLWIVRLSETEYQLFDKKPVWDGVQWQSQGKKPWAVEFLEPASMKIGACYSVVDFRFTGCEEVPKELQQEKSKYRPFTALELRERSKWMYTYQTDGRESYCPLHADFADSSSPLVYLHGKWRTAKELMNGLWCCRPDSQHDWQLCRMPVESMTGKWLQERFCFWRGVGSNWDHDRSVDQNAWNGLARDIESALV